MKERPVEICTELGKHKAKAAVDAGKDSAGKLIKGVLGNVSTFSGGNTILNQRVSASADDIWITTDQWSACATQFNADELKGKRCVLGLDMSSSVDLTALDATVVGADLTYATALSMASTADQANIC